MITAVSYSAGSPSSRRSSVVLPEPRKPVSKVTGVNAGAASTIGIQSGQQLRIKRIAAAARQSLGRGPEMAKVADDLALAGESRKQERRALPIGEPQAVELQHAISDLHAASALLPAPRRIVVAREDALARDRVSPMLVAIETAAERAHEPLFLLFPAWKTPCEIVGHLIHRDELYARMRRDVAVEPFQHQEHLWPPGDIGVNGDGEHRIVIFAIDPVELIAPGLLKVARTDEAVTVRALLDEHHRRQIVEIPVRRHFDEISLVAALQRHHPFLRLLGIVDLGPAIAHPDIIRMEVIVHQ